MTINGAGFGTSPTVTLPAGVTSSGQGSTDTRIVLNGVNVAFTATIGNNSIKVTANNTTSSPANFVIDGPAKMIVQRDVIGPTSGNPNNKSRFVTYEIHNFSGALAGSIPIAENLSVTGYNCTQPDPGFTYAHCDGTYHARGGGGLTDEWSMYTGYTPAGCGDNTTDHWQWCGPTGSNPPAPNPGITFGTLTGWVHTVDSKINGYKNPPSPIPAGTVFVP